MRSTCSARVPDFLCSRSVNFCTGFTSVSRVTFGRRVRVLMTESEGGRERECVAARQGRALSELQGLSLYSHSLLASRAPDNRKGTTLSVTVTNPQKKFTPFLFFEDKYVSLLLRTRPKTFRKQHLFQKIHSIMLFIFLYLLYCMHDKVTWSCSQVQSCVKHHRYNPANGDQWFIHRLWFPMSYDEI